MKEMFLRHRVRYLIICACILVILILNGIGNYYKNVLRDINMAKEWDKDGGYTQMSVYLPVGAITDTSVYDGTMYQMQNALKNENIEAKNSKSRILVGAYSGYGNITLKTQSAAVSTDVIGVGGDFFYFHPLNMIDGECFDSDYLMQDYVVLDKNTAWKLFGAINVSGMMVEIGGIPFLVAGVYEPTDVPLAKEAGMDGGTVFMFYSAMEQYGSSSGIQWLDFMIPNPVKGYGEKILTENSMADLQKGVVIEESSRFNVLSLYGLLPDYAQRSMSKTGIIYPYWENMARGYENILVAFLLVETVCLLCGVVLLLITLRPVKNIKKGMNWLVTRIRGRKTI